jgi:hypothetical protein
MLVYLDSAQLAWLHRAGESQRNAFFDQWNSRGLTLAVSLHHLQEIAQLVDDESMERRLAVLSRFNSLRGVPRAAAGVLEWEAVAQIRERLGHELNVRAEGRTEIFPPNTAEELASAFPDNLKGLRGLGSINQMASEAEENGRSLAKLGFGRAKKANVEHMRKHGPAFAEELSTQQPELAPLIRATMEHVIASLEASGGDIRKAKLMQWGLADAVDIGSVPDEDLAISASFYFMAREAASEISSKLNVPEEQVLRLVKDLNPYHALGFRLVLAVQRARRAHPMGSAAADQEDQNHLIFAPYVDLMFVDKRTLDFVRREEGRDVRLPTGSGSNLRRARGLDDVLTHIDVLARTTRE